MSAPVILICGPLTRRAVEVKADDRLRRTDGWYVAACEVREGDVIEALGRVVEVRR